MKTINQDIRLTFNEKMLIADSLNGVDMLNADPSYITRMIGVGGNFKNLSPIIRHESGRVQLPGTTCASGLELQLHDSIWDESLDSKWSVDGVELIQKIRALSPEKRQFLLHSVSDIWSRCDENFERDVAAIDI